MKNPPLDVATCSKADGVSLAAALARAANVRPTAAEWLLWRSAGFTFRFLPILQSGGLLLPHPPTQEITPRIGRKT